MRSGNRLRYLGYILPFFVTGILSGCASTEETARIQQSVSMLNQRQMEMERRVESSEGQAKKGGDLYAKLEELQMRMGRLNGRIDELEHKFDLLQRQAQAAPPAETTPPAPVVAEPMQPPTQFTQPQQQAMPPLAAQQPRVTQPVPQAAPPVAPPPAVEPDKIAFEKASGLLQHGKYDAARKDFQALIAKYPKSEYASDSLFNIGECYVAEKRYQDAIEAYQQVLDKYPRGTKAPQALLKQGTAFQQIGDVTAARIIYERLVEKYPGTPSAQAAEKKLKQLH